jgi:hypothetical protein
MKSQPKSRHVGAGVVTRYRDGACTFTCRHSGCRTYSEPRGWRAGLRMARQHAADHDATETRYVDTPWGVPAHELPRHARRRRPLRRLAAAMLILALAALALSLTVANVNSHAAPVPGPTTTQAPYEYVPVPAGAPGSSAGGDR